MFFKKRNVYLGLDIGTHTIKIIQVKKVGSLARITRVLAFPTPKEAFAGEDMERPDLISDALKSAAREQKLFTGNVISAIPEKHVITRQIKMPVMPAEELAASLQWEVEKYIPLSAKDLVIDLVNLGVEDGEQGKETNVLLIALPRDLAVFYCQALDEAGFKLFALDSVPFALCRCLSCTTEAGPENGEPPVYACLDMGASGTNVIIYRGDIPVFSRNIPIGGNSLTDAISAGLGIDWAEAERLKVERWETVPEALDFLRPQLAEMALGVSRCLDFVKKGWQGRTIDVLHLTGGTAMLPGLALFMSEQLGVPVQLGNPLVCLAGYIDPKTQEKNKSAINPIFAVAMGLALREVMP